MADHKDGTKATGDTHLPEVESELPAEPGGNRDLPGTGGSAGQRAKATEPGREGRAGRGARQAGVPGDKDTKGGDGLSG